MFTESCVESGFLHPTRLVLRYAADESLSLNQRVMYLVRDDLDQTWEAGSWGWTWRDPPFHTDCMLAGECDMLRREFSFEGYM